MLINKLEAGKAYIVTTTALNKKGTSLAVHKIVETLQHPELQLIEEKIEPQRPPVIQSELIICVSVGSGLCLLLLLAVGLWLRNYRCGSSEEGSSDGKQRSLLHCGANGLEYSNKYSGSGLTTSVTGVDEEEEEDIRHCQRKNILIYSQQSCESSPDLIPHHDQGWYGPM